MRRSSHPPAWYPDPHDPARIRRWNGRTWTDDVRPLPDWLRTLRLSPGPPNRVPRTSSRLWATSAALLLIGAVLMAMLGTSRDDVDRLQDKAFIASANDRCAATEVSVITPNRRHLDGAAEAARIDALAAGWETMIDDLRQLPRTPEDAPKIDRWLRSWDQWTTNGRAYADALRARDEREATRVLERSEPHNAAKTRFALVNGMNDCLFGTR